MPAARTWLTASEAARRLLVSPKTVPAGPTRAASITDAPWAATVATTPS